MALEIFFIVFFPLLLWVICFLSTGSDRKNLIGLRSYPLEVQRKVKENETIREFVPKKKTIFMILLSNFILFSVLFLPVAFLLRYKGIITSYLDSFVYFLILGETINFFDFLIIDLLWWRNTKRIRFSFLPEKENYRDIREHLYSLLRGIPMYVGVALLVSCVMLV